MRFLLLLLVAAVLARLSGMVIPYWWGIAPGAVLAGWWLARNNLQAFAGGFFGLALLWGAYAAAADRSSQGLISERLAALSGLGSPWMALLLTALLGGLTGAVACWAGFRLRRAMKQFNISRPKTNNPT
jgi:hypothetical protein